MQKIKKDYSKDPIYDAHRDVFISEAVVRPTGLIDPEIIIVPAEKQVEDAINRIQLRIKKNQRTLITTLTKKFAEDLDIYMKSIGIKSTYVHSDVDTMKRLDILKELREGIYDVLIGINLLREGLDLPEVSLVCIFDADKEGFLRSGTSLIQIIGRAARHLDGQAIMYADKITNSMSLAIADNEYKRAVQTDYNKIHNITPKSTIRSKENMRDIAEVKNILTKEEPKPIAEEEFAIESRFSQKGKKGKTKQASIRAASIENNFELLKEVKKQELNKLELNQSEMTTRLQIAIDAMDFETAAALRDMIKDNNAKVKK
jgi:excinuclease ABC subunit B